MSKPGCPAAITGRITGIIAKKVVVRIDTVLLKVASRCNLNCSYCYVYNMGDESWRAMPKRMAPETQALVAKKLRSLFSAQAHPFAVVLHGGEPLLLGVSRLRSLFDVLKDALPSECPVSIQTNGVLLNQPVLDLCAAFGVGLSVSLDGPSDVHDKHRLNLRGRTSHSSVAAGLAKLRSHPCAATLFSGVLAVVDPTSDPNTIYDYFKTIGTPSVDFLYRDGNRSTLPYGKTSVETSEYGRWMSVILDRYVADPDPPRIRLLDDMIKLILGASSAKEGVGLTDFGILVIDTDGSITKNDTLKSTPLGDRFEGSWTVKKNDLVEVVRSTEYREYHEMQRPSSPICGACPELSICGGGMLTHRFDDENGYDNPTVFCSDQKFLINRMRHYLHLFRRAAA
jgi:uncharacterized protein